MNYPLDITVLPHEMSAHHNIEETIYDLQKQIDNLSCHADTFDYLLSISSGIVCAMLDILWVGEFSLENSRIAAVEDTNKFVEKVAKVFGCEEEGLQKSVAFLENSFPLASDGNTKIFGGGLQHHLRDFAHHPTIAGLIFSLLTQFTEQSYGTDKFGKFIVQPIPDKSKKHIGTNIHDKLINGTVIWFFHLVSDMAGSSSSVGQSGGTGIPGPILALAKELSALPFIHELKCDDIEISKFLSKMFNGTLFAKRDNNGKMIKETAIKFDLRGELGCANELTKQAIPVAANECIVRSFYFIRQLISEVKENDINTISELTLLDWGKFMAQDPPTLTRMLTISAGVFTTIDITEAVLSQKYLVSVNYAGIGHFTVALNNEMIGFLSIRQIQQIKSLYEEIEQNTFHETDNNIYKRLETTMEMEKFGLTLEQTEILYNLELHKTLNDIAKTSSVISTSKIKDLKQAWIDEWVQYISLGFPSFVGIEDAELHWFSETELIAMIQKNQPEKPWLRLVLLEAMLFEPYFPLSLEKNKKGDDIPSTKYNSLHSPISGYKKAEGDLYLDALFTQNFQMPNTLKRFRKCYSKVAKELNEVLKTVITSISVAAVISLAVILTAGMFAPAIAVALVGSSFSGLSGAALTSACLAYLGGGAIAVGGLGMAGGTMAIVGGGAILGLGVGTGIGSTVGVVSAMNEKQTVLQSAKLLVSVREIFLNDEHDLEYSNTVLEQYVQNIANIEKGLVELKLQAALTSKDEQKRLNQKIDNAEKSVKAMKIAMKSMNKYNSSFETGINSMD